MFLAQQRGISRSMGARIGLADRPSSKFFQGFRLFCQAFCQISQSFLPSFSKLSVGCFAGYQYVTGENGGFLLSAGVAVAALPRAQHSRSRSNFQA